MYLKKISVRNYKNLAEKDLIFSPGINCFLGNNGRGKTNLLDAIYFLSMGKSYLNYSDVQNIRFDQDFMSVKGTYQKEDQEDVIFCSLQLGHKKTIRKNNKAYKKLSDHVGQYPLVMVSPYDRDLITEGSDIRRKFMDNVISQSNPRYLSQLMAYNRCLQQRNALLKYFFVNQTFDAISLLMYDEKLSEWGKEIHEIRKAFMLDFGPKFQSYYSLISQDKERVSLTYESKLNERTLRELLKENVAIDRKTQHTTVGIHKDDLTFLINGHPVKKYGSQGQQKSYVIALKLAKLQSIKEQLNFTPILLLDDIFDKLDEERVEQLVRMVNEEHFGQIFITDTHPKRTAEIVSRISSESKLFEL